MTPSARGATKRIRVVAAFLIVGLAAGPAASHIYWLLGGTWGLHRTVVGDRVVEEGATSTGTRIVAAVVVVLLIVRGVGRPGAGRIVAAGVRVKPGRSVLRLGAGGGIPGRDPGGLHLE